MTIGASHTPTDPPDTGTASPAQSPGGVQAAQRLFDLPAADRTPGTTGSGRSSIVRRLDVERLVAVERAAALASEPVAQFWRRLTTSAESAVTAQSVDSLFRQSLLAMSQLLGVDTVAILLANERGDELMARAAIGLSEEVTLGIGIRAGEGMAGRVLASRRPLLVGDLSAIHVVNPVLRNSGLRSVVAVPLLGREDQPLGVMYAAGYELDQFSEADASLLQLLAGRLAAAVERVRLFDAERAARRDAERLADRIGRMHEITARLAAVTTTGQAAEVLAGSLVTEVAGPSPWWTAVWLLEDDRLVPAAHATGDAPLPPPRSIDLASDLAPARAAELRRPLYFSGPESAEAFTACSLEDAGMAEGPFDGGGFAVLPIPSPDGCLGVVALAYPRWQPFGSDERGFLEAVVRQAALAFDRLRLAAQQEQLASLASFFAGAARTVAEADDLRQTLDRLADLSLEALGELCLIDLVGEDGNGVRMVAKHREPEWQHLADRLRTEFPPDRSGVHPATEVLRSGATRWSDHMSDGFLRATTRGPDHFALVKALGFRSYVTVPIVGSNEVLGTLTSVSCSRRFRTDDVALAEELAGQVAGLVEGALRFDAAARTSRVLQASLLPRNLPAVDGLSVDTRYLPGTRSLQVGGDFYDFYRLPSGAVGFAIGDVAGHDRAAAALMGHLRTSARALAAQTGSPGTLVAALRDNWDLLGFDRIATAVFGRLDPATGALALASAGHYPPLRKRGHDVDYLPVPAAPPLGAPLGTAGVPAAQWEGTLDPAEVLLLYTDGVVDERTAGSEASMAGLASLVAEAPARPDAVLGAVVAHLAEDRADDAALLAIRLDTVRPPAEPTAN